MWNDALVEAPLSGELSAKLTEGWLEFPSSRKSASNGCCKAPAPPQSRLAVPQENLRFPCGSLPYGQTSKPKGLLPWPSQLP